MRGELTAECAERLLGVFDALAGPAPETDGVKDRRSAGQRRHDALLDALTRLCLAGSLPAAGGIATTVIVMMSDQSFRTGTGLDETSHGAPLGDGGLRPTWIPPPHIDPEQQPRRNQLHEKPLRQ